MIDRIPPNDTDMEQALISAILINNNGFEDIHLSPEDFYSKRHGIIFSAMLELRMQKDPVDLMTLANQLEKRGELEDIGGAAYLVQISDSAPVATHKKAYARKIKDLAVVREGIRNCMEIIDAGYSTTDPAEFIASAQKQIMSLEVSGVQDQATSLDHLCIRAMDRIKSAQEGTAAPGLSFGFPLLSKGMHVSGSKLIIIAARPGMGKTALMLSIAKFLAYQGVRVSIISIEMDGDELTDRYLSDEADINSLCFYKPGMLGKRAMDDLDLAAGNLAYLPIHIDDSSCKIHDVERKCRKAKKDGSQIIFIDQLSKISYPRGMGQYEGFTTNCNRIAELKKELRTPIVLLSQLNRELEKRNNKRPVLSDLKQTGAIEEDADIILFVYRDGYYLELATPGCNADQSETEIICAKNRNGATGVEKGISFYAKRGMFRGFEA